jgi:hypothetical protein
MYDGDGQRVQTVAYVMGIPLRALPRPPTAWTGAAVTRCWSTVAAASALSFMGCLLWVKLATATGTTTVRLTLTAGLGDGRFSVRQLVNESGNLALTRSKIPSAWFSRKLTAVGDVLFGFMGAQQGIVRHKPDRLANFACTKPYAKARYVNI